MYRIRLMLLSLFLAAVLFAAGCGASSKPVERINGEAITQDQFMKGLESGIGLTEQFTAGKRVLDTMISMKLVEKEAADKGVSVSDAELKKAMNDAKQSVKKMSGQSFEEYLKQMGAKEADLQAQLEFSILLKKLVVTKSDVEEYFKAHAAD